MKSNCGDPTVMSKVNYAMFGLGDHNYPHYQAASIVISDFFICFNSQLADHQLQKMGAHPIMELTKGDAAEDIDSDYEAWHAALIEKLKSMQCVS